MPKPLSPVIIIISVSILIILIAFGLLWLPGELTQKHLAQVTFPDGFAVIADVADTSVLRASGLSGRPYLAADEGMLFVFEAYSLPSFWMPNMKFPIDLIWIDVDVIVSISENAQPERGIPLMRYSPDEPVNRVLEVPGGTAGAHGLKAGDRLDIQVEEK